MSGRTRRGTMTPGFTLGMVIIWVLLWGDLSVANVLAGTALVVLMALLFPQPPPERGQHLRPLACLRFLGRFAVELVQASAQVTRAIFRFGREPSCAVVAVDLRSRSDLMLTLIALALSLVPGSVIIEVRRATGTLYVHSLDVSDQEGIERVRRQVRDLERRLVRAVGSTSDLRRVERS
ncbi:Na+/H+ antiporter subunit E [Bailinhaonella thermotolerans]|uniref:Na+/H+ antiporter subunit E n=1 Tax=Bailinhaonella thermotolerans TaxID=1070861 RepID=A0A3A4APR7_9ACTN|nr:Na+/H+ antiporter subunit E [Bailinhaonella thermotolerans]RJL31666.1 Na+/H+ antiporter subunit E [Bailinhaonella thermotolerans]